MKKKYTILHEDDHLVIINKSAPFLTIPDRFNSDKINLYQSLKNKYGEIFTVHRLDMETSGVICFAKTADAHKHLSQQFEARTTQKIYHAIVQGVVTNESGEINEPIAAHLHIAGKMTTHKKGKPSLTYYRVVERFKRYSLVELDLKTGRTHQIRVHLSSIGHSLAIDRLYSNKEAFYLSEIKQRSYKTSKFEQERPLMNRLSLHAHQLTIQHPQTQEKVTFEAPLPKDFRAMLQQLRKWGK
ncbi:MAG: RluA family pseudouridine synthase [Bacteroidota bacterium]